ncbi:DUF3231 family protein [Bacillus circulans]|nr:DUF3231 family protein [Niallia circulans]
MKKISHDVELTTAEIANLWTQYINDSLSICILTHSIEKQKTKTLKKYSTFPLALLKPISLKLLISLLKRTFPFPKVFQWRKMLI